MALADVSDVEARLGRTLHTEEAAKVPGLLDEASVLVEGYCGRTFDSPVPLAVRVVVSKLVVRGLTSDVTTPEVSGAQYQAGPFGFSPTFAGDGARMWLGSGDKLMLKPFRIAMRPIGLVSDMWPEGE